MNSPARKSHQAVPFNGAQLPRGSATDRLCDLDGCQRPSEALVAEVEGSILLVCTSCATSMTEPRQHETAPDTIPMQVVPRDAPTETRVLPVRPSAPAASSGSASRSWTWWLRLLVGVLLVGWGMVVCAGAGSDFDGVATASVGAYLLLNLARPRYRD